MTRQEAFLSVSEIIGEVLARKDITEKSSLVTDLQCDSLDAIEISLNLEEWFGIEIEDFEMKACKTVGDIVSLVEKKKGQK